MEEKKMLRVSFRLEEEYKKLLAELAKMGRRGMTDELRIALDERAERMGLTPVEPVKEQTN